MNKCTEKVIEKRPFLSEMDPIGGHTFTVEVDCGGEMEKKGETNKNVYGHDVFKPERLLSGVVACCLYQCKVCKDIKIY